MNHYFKESSSVKEIVVSKFQSKGIDRRCSSFPWAPFGLNLSHMDQASHQGRQGLLASSSALGSALAANSWRQHFAYPPWAAYLGPSAQV